jgi:hypothetical protein
VNTERVIVSSLPFLLAAMAQFLSSRVRTYATHALRLYVRIADEESGTDNLKLAVDLAVHTYLHISFVFSCLMASLTCVVYTIYGTRPWLAAVGACALVLLLPTWLFYWQHLHGQELEGKHGRAMRGAAWAMILIQWAATLAGQF